MINLLNKRLVNKQLVKNGFEKIEKKLFWQQSSDIAVCERLVGVLFFD